MELRTEEEIQKAIDLAQGEIDKPIIEALIKMMNDIGIGRDNE